MILILYVDIRGLPTQINNVYALCCGSSLCYRLTLLHVHSSVLKST